MVEYAKIRTNAVILNPIADPAIPGSIFNDVSLSAISLNNTGTPIPIPTAAVAGNIKKMQVAPTFSIRAGKPVSKRADGFVVEADSDGAGSQQPIGIALKAMSLNAIDDILIFGANAKDALIGVICLPGDEIYIDEEAGGYVNSLASLHDNNDSMIKVGVADCSEGAASAVAVDLILLLQVIARP